MKMTTVLFVCLSMSAGNAFAHDEGQHAGKPVHGTIASMAEDSLTLATDGGPLTVRLPAGTKVERGEKDISRGELKSGMHVSVFGTKVPGEGLVAKEIVISERAPDGAKASHAGH